MQRCGQAWLPRYPVRLLAGARGLVGQCVALYQVTVKKVQGGSWEVGAVDATLVADCPADLAGGLRAETDTSETAGRATSLTRRQSVDCDAVPAKASTVSGLLSVIVPQAMRQLNGIFEVHCVAVMGVSALASDGAWQIRSCSECKRKVPDENDVCPTHPEKAVELRWLLSMEIADNTGRGQAVMYHDAAVGVDAFAGAAGPIDAQAERKIASALRGCPVSSRPGLPGQPAP